MNSTVKVLAVMLAAVLLTVFVSSCRRSDDRAIPNPSTPDEVSSPAPGGEAPVGEPDMALWAQVENRTYAGTDLCAPEDIYSGSPELLKDRIFPIYGAPVNNENELRELLRPVADGSARLRDSLTVYDDRFGGLSVFADTGGVGMEEFYFYTPIFQDGKEVWCWSAIWGNGTAQVNGGGEVKETGVSYPSGVRVSLNMTPDLAGRLEEAGFAPETAQALHFSLGNALFDGLITGVLFYDDQQEYVLCTGMQNAGGESFFAPDGRLLTAADFARLADQKAEDLFFYDPQTGGRGGQNPST